MARSIGTGLCKEQGLPANRVPHVVGSSALKNGLMLGWMQKKWPGSQDHHDSEKDIDPGNNL